MRNLKTFVFFSVAFNDKIYNWKQHAETYSGLSLGGGLKIVPERPTFFGGLAPSPGTI